VEFEHKLALYMTTDNDS